MQHPYTQCQQQTDRTWARLRVLALCALVLPMFGCNSFGNGKLVQQLQNENDRLLTEFRAERKRREESERLNATLEARLSESEKLLARQTMGTVPDRLSSLQQNKGKPVGTLPAISPNGFGTKPDAGSDSETSTDSDFRWQRRVN